MANLRAKLPQLHDFKDPQEQIEVDTIAKIKAKMTDILGDYPDSEDKTIVSDLVSQTVVAGCIAYDIDPVELIVIPRPTQQGEHHVAMADRKKVGPLDIKQLFIDPYRTRADNILQIGLPQTIKDAEANRRPRM